MISRSKKPKIARKRELGIDDVETLMEVINAMGRASVLTLRMHAIADKQELAMLMRGKILGGKLSVLFEFDGRKA